MKLCVDMNGAQPRPEMHPDDRVYLNAGQYLLPIVYGTVPTDGPFTEELMDSLPHIHGAYLAVRLFDPAVDVPNPADDDEYMPYAQHVDYGKYVVDTSVAGSIVHAMPYSDPAVRKIPISEFILDEIQRGEEIGEGEKRVVLRQCLEWMASSFPPLKSKLPLIDARFMLSYEDRFGAFCALDMLYQMPQQPSLLGVTKRSLGPQSIFSAKKYDNKIRHFKTYFRYLPGFIPKKHGGKGQPKEETLADMVIDDASLDLNLASPEYNPIFNDDFSRTVGIELTQNACLLVVVSAVDILTSTALANQPAHIHPSQPTSTQPHHNDFQYYGSSPTRNGRATTSNNHALNGFLTPDDGMRKTGEEEKGFKLRGLRGIYFNENHVDVNAVWWGIIPLLIESPFEKDAHGNKVVPKPVFSPMKALKAAASAIGFTPEGGGGGGEDSGTQDPPKSAVVKKLKDISPGMRRSHSSKKMLMSLEKSKSVNRIAIKRDKSNSNMRSQWMEVNDNDMDVMDISPESSFRGGGGGSNTGRSSQRQTPMRRKSFGNGALGDFETPNSRAPTSKTTGRTSAKNTAAGVSQSPAVIAAVTQAAIQAQAEVLSVNNGHWFVNAGTHQVPLFQGLPPEELFLAANPMAWVLAQLAHLPTPTELAKANTPLPHATSLTAHSQAHAAGASENSLFGGLFGCGSAHSSTDVIVSSTTPSSANSGTNSSVERRAGAAAVVGGTTAAAQPVVKQSKTAPTRYHLQLATGCSAFISIIDPRLRSFSHDSVSRDPTVPIRSDTIEKLLRAQLLRHMKYFQSNSNKSAGRKRRLPKNFHPNAMQSVNRAVYAAEEEEKQVRRKRQQAYQFDMKLLQRAATIRRYESAIPPSILAPTLFQEINYHFMEIISEND